MKKNSIMVKQVLMSIITAGIFTFGFTSCSDDDPMSQDGAAANQELTGTVLMSTFNLFIIS